VAALAGRTNDLRNGTVNASLQALLSPERLTDVIDVGAKLGEEGPPPYTPMLAAGLCRVTGFEPQKSALLELQALKGPNERYLPYAVGDGGTHTLNICRHPGMTSLLEPDPVRLSLFANLPLLGEVIERIVLQTRKLDDISEIQHLDFLKIDIQGGELAVFQGGKTKLAEAVAIQTEISFVTLYKNQPSLGDIDLELRSQGFLPHCVAEVNSRQIGSFLFNNSLIQTSNQLLEADLVYVRDIAHTESMSDEQLKHLALIAHHCYGSFDLALHSVMLLEQRQALEAGAQQRYLEILSATYR
jgi:FkbM family methyltransferase